MTLLDAAEKVLVPTELMAATLKVYETPLVKPVTVRGLEVAVTLKLPEVELATYDVITTPPFDTGAVKLMVACALPATAVTDVGAPGAVKVASTLWITGLAYVAIRAEVVAVGWTPSE